jgi:hypothetical protein
MHRKILSPSTRKATPMVEKSASTSASSLSVASECKFACYFSFIEDYNKTG